ncbi:hypothetical protein NDU88_003494 [Pleurodeles waltl]|uniref:Receptor ligand binding region domain-containing protein n=1 Tax=Pleurodeles waltl TaxID=8319 RepID=A0AAV7UYL8_PLEWA|nr:hypothetical protein NDU88_003494 [Pleurodeles waltl]
MLAALHACLRHYVLCLRRSLPPRFTVLARAALHMPLLSNNCTGKAGCEKAVSYGATVPLLEDKQNFQSFFQSAPNDEVQSMAISLLVARYKWNWVGILAEENDYGLHSSQILMKELERVGACIAFYDTLSTVFSIWKSESIIKSLQTTTAKVVIIFSSDDSIFLFMVEFV